MSDWKKDTRTPEEQAHVTVTERSEIRKEMAVEAKDTIGSGYVDNYYYSVGQGYAILAERYVEDARAFVIKEQVIPRDELIEELINVIDGVEIETALMNEMIDFAARRGSTHGILVGEDANARMFQRRKQNHSELKKLRKALLTKAHSHGYGKPPMTP